jgi:hypothetical protein
MNINDLKSMWHDAHNANQENGYDNVNIEKSIHLNHSKIISKVLSDLKLKMLGYIIVLLILTGLMIYALLYLHLHFTVNSLVLFSFIGLFFFIKIISEMNRMLFLTKTANNMSVKESILRLRKKLIRMKAIDFISYLVYFYALAIWSAFSYINDIGGIKNLYWGSAMQQLVMIVILMLLFIPWLIKYQTNQRYKKIVANLNDSVRLLSEEL